MWLTFYDLTPGVLCWSWPFPAITQMTYIAKEECDTIVCYISSWETAKDLWLKPLTYHAIHAQQVLHHWCYMNLKTFVGYVQNTAHAAVKKKIRGWFNPWWIISVSVWPHLGPDHSPPPSFCLLKVPIRHEYFQANIAIHEYCPSSSTWIFLPESSQQYMNIAEFHLLYGTNIRGHDYSQSSTPSQAQTCNYKMNGACTEYS